MSNNLKPKYATARKIFPFFILAVIVVLCSHVLIFRAQYNQDIEEVSETDQQISNLEWDYIRSVLYEDFLAAQTQSKGVAMQITRDLRAAYPDITVLKSQMENPLAVSNPQYLQIMKNDIRNIYLYNIANDSNDIFICNRDGVIMDLSLSTAGDSYPNTWDKVYARHVNPKLAELAVGQIFDQTEQIIFWQDKAPFGVDTEGGVKNHYLMEAPTIQELRKLYDNEGLEGLRYIEFLAPAYITTSGDIFGVEDIDIHGVKTVTSKIVVVQTFNLYQQLMTRHSAELARYEAFRQNMVKDRRFVLTEHAFYVIIITILVILTVYFLMAFNNIIFHENHHMPTKHHNDPVETKDKPKNNKPFKKQDNHSKEESGDSNKHHAK